MTWRCTCGLGQFQDNSTFGTSSIATHEEALTIHKRLRAEGGKEMAVSELLKTYKATRAKYGLPSHPSSQNKNLKAPDKPAP